MSRSLCVIIDCEVNPSAEVCNNLETVKALAHLRTNPVVGSSTESEAVLSTICAEIYLF